MMHAMDLLRGFSEIDPCYMEAAAAAGDQPQPAGSAEPMIQSTQTDVSPDVQTARSGTKYRLAGWIAAAACFVMIAGAALHTRFYDPGLVMPSSQINEIVEVTVSQTEDTLNVMAQTTTTAFTVTSQPESSESLTDADTGTAPADTGVPDDDTPAVTTGAQQTDIPESQTTVSSTTTVQTTSTTAAQTYAARVPVLVGMGDDSGQLRHADGSDFTVGESSYEIVTDRAAIQQYLDGSEPVVMLGDGQKSADVTAQIMENCGMIRVRWQTERPWWEEYGIQSAQIDSSGVLKLQICMYSGLIDPIPDDPWVYETALLYENGTLPPVTDVQVTLQYYQEGISELTGQLDIVQWLLFNSVLNDDLYIRTKN